MLEIRDAFLSVLRLHNFRNYDRARFEFSEKVTFIHGANGSGKTNILDAISRLYDGGGLKTAQAKDAIKISSPAAGWSVRADMISQEAVYDIFAGLTGERGRKVLKIDNVSAAYRDVSNITPCLWLNHIDEKLFTEDRAEIRKFFNRAVQTLFPAFGAALSDYESAVKERMRLLTGERTPLDAELSARERLAAEAAREINRFRTAFLENFRDCYRFVAPDLGEEPRFTIEYVCESDGVSAAEFAVRSEQNRGLDARIGRTMFGPHRVNWRITRECDGAEAAQCSAGEQKAMMLIILCVLARATAEKTGVSPLLLADDFPARLDIARQKRFLSYFTAAPGQVLLTGTDAPGFSVSKMTTLTPQSGVRVLEAPTLF